MKHGDQHSSELETDMTEDLNTGHEAHQSWDAQPAVPDDGFGDSAASEKFDEGEDEVVPAKNRGGMMLPLLLFVLVLGAGGFAYWQFGMNAYNPIASNRSASVATPAAPVMSGASSAATPVPATPSAETLASPASLPTAVAPPAESVVAQGVLSPLPPVPSAPAQEPAQAPVSLPSPPLPPPVLSAPATTIETPDVVPSAPAVAATDSSQPLHGGLPASIEPVMAADAANEIAALKKTIAELQEKVTQLNADVAGKDSTLNQMKAQLQTLETAKNQQVAASAPTPAVNATKTASREKTAVTAKKSPSKKAQLNAGHDKKPKASVTAVAAKTEAKQWVLRSVTSGAAWIAASQDSSDLKEIHVGDTVPGLGNIKSIASKDGRWVVEGSTKNLQ